MIVELKGNLDMPAAKFLDAKLKEIISMGSIVVLNCKNLTSIGSGGIRSIMMAAKALKDFQGHFALCEMPDRIKNVFELSGMTNVFPVYKKERDALEALEILK